MFHVSSINVPPIIHVPCIVNKCSNESLFIAVFSNVSLCVFSVLVCMCNMFNICKYVNEVWYVQYVQEVRYMFRWFGLFSVQVIVQKNGNDVCEEW